MKPNIWEFSLMLGTWPVRTIVRSQMLAAAACDDVATGLCIQPGTPVLRIERRYEAGPEGVVEIAVSHHPAGRYSYDLTLRQTG